MPYSALLEPINNFLYCSTPKQWLAMAKEPINLKVLLIDHANAEWKAAATASKLMLKYAGANQPLIQQEIKALLAPYEFIIFRAGRWSVQVFIDWFFPLGLDKANNEQLKAALTTLALMQRCKFDQQLLSQLHELVGSPSHHCTHRASTLSAKAETRSEGQLSDFQIALIEKMRLLIKEELHHFEQVFSIMRQFNIHYQNLPAGSYAKGLMSQVRHYEPQALADKLIVGAYIEARSCERFAMLAPLLPEAIGQFYISLLRSEARHYQDYLSLANMVIDEQELQQRVKKIGQQEAQLIYQQDKMFRFHSGIPLS
ncbi:tRNA isopentenyl-2-thiomethyl-A-37 hydroxylase MiaE [Agarivorans litoreus]|uniref:tRNA isopentenyl-2-thiomethyl-A-37 hydroxylase MiaE n=1 Tax=Agarivorans litoreus TaxID=1510455 RepID=UPI002484B091|nr:tRNA isopentenyl-2-thiomethyl-A-37 hydroxylase MiaE [Agarivorans litoreus]